MQKPTVVIYTDGAYSRGYGGWAATILYTLDGTYTCIAGDSTEDGPDTTNNRMEMLAAIKALEFLKTKANVTLYSDSQYLVNGCSYQAELQKKRGWKTADGSPVKNQDLWERLLKLKKKHAIKFKWVKGHAGHQDNEIVNSLAQTMRTLMEDHQRPPRR